MQINYPPFLITAAHMSKLAVKIIKRQLQWDSQELHAPSPQIFIPSCLFPAQTRLGSPWKFKVLLLLSPLSPAWGGQSRTACRGRSGDRQTTLEGGQDKICSCTALPGHNRFNMGCSPSSNVHKDPGCSKIKYQKCWHRFSQSQQLAEWVYLFLYDFTFVLLKTSQM